MTYLFLDSNIFLQFQDFEYIKWPKICDNQNITIVITGIAIREVDKKKDSSRSKLREKAKRISKKVNRILRGEQTSKYPLIHVTFPNKSTMLSPVFNKEINDDWLVHTANDFVLPSETDEKIIISNDYNVYTRALPFNIRVLEVPEKYLLPQELTDEEKRIKELENRIASYENSCANIVISFDNGTSYLHHDYVERPDFSCRKSEIRTDLEANVPYKNFAPQTPAEIVLAAFRDFTLTEDDYRLYNSLLPEYYDKESDFLYLKEICDFISDNMVPISFQLENNGAAKSGVIGLYLDFSTDAKVYTNNARISFETSRVKKPELKSIWQRKLDIPMTLGKHVGGDKIFSWNLEELGQREDLHLFEKYNPIIHRHPPIVILENTFYLFKCVRQQFSIKWRLTDSLSPDEKEGELIVDIS